MLERARVVVDVRFERRGVSLVSVADALDTRSAAGRLVLNIMVSVSQWEREAIGERTRDAMRHKRAKGERVGTVPFGARLAADGVQLEADAVEQALLARGRHLKAAAACCARSRRPSMRTATERAAERRGASNTWRMRSGRADFRRLLVAA
jgi:DNA invertase Pin-like site-specific DNA recombinase